MVKRLFDVCAAGAALLLTAPLVAAAALGIRISSPGPVLYRARRAGRYGREFTMYKLRTMQARQGPCGARLTAPGDRRVFPFGRLLRLAKVDELPQLVNVLRGDMSIIGPRPEEPEFVALYSVAHWETLAVRPGLASPGSLYHDTHGALFLEDGDPETRYVERLLPLKLALDLVYVRRASFGYDLAIIGRTIRIITLKLLGRRTFADPPEMAAARMLLVQSAEHLWRRSASGPRAVEPAMAVAQR
jgi:lipopolysaccharide/colanic/teichoic acid biosynthesis glycosyltransferase